MNDKHNKKLSFHHDRKHVIFNADVSFCYYQAAEEAAEADTATEPPFSKGTLLVGQPFVMSITVLQAQGIPVPYTDVFCQIR